MLFSVIIPVYKVEKYIFQALESLRTQSFTDWEAVIVDDGSPDASADICQKFCDMDSRFHLIHQENAGLSAARNTGMKHAKGEYLLYFDSDDYLGADFLAEFAKKIAICPVDIVCSGGYIQTFEDEVGNITEKISGYKDAPLEILSGINAYSYIIDRWEFVFCAPVWQRCYKRSFLEKHHLFFAHGRLHEDEQWTPRVFYLAETVSFTSYIGYYYRQRQGSIVMTLTEKNVSHLAQNIEDLCDFFTNNTCDNPVMGNAFFRPLIGLYNAWIFFDNYNAKMQKTARKLRIHNKLHKRIRTLPMYQYATWSIKMQLFVGEITCYLPFLRWPLIVAFKGVNFLRK